MAGAGLASECERLRSLQVPGEPLLLPNAWDAATARAVVEAGFPVVATPSGGVAAALALAEAMSQTPAAVTDEIYAEARRHFSDQQMVELAATAALENYRARFNCCFGVESHNLYSADVATESRV